MPADTQSKYYEARKPEWEKIAAIVAGEEAVREAGEDYLPKLTGQSEREYDAYKARGSFFNATARTLQGLTGAVMRRDPIVKVPEPMEALLDNVTLTGLSFTEAVRLCVSNVINYGYYGILVDMPVGESDRPYMAPYSAFDILNFRTKKVQGEDVLTMLVLAEELVTPVGEDIFETETTEQIRVLILEDGYVVVRLYQKDAKGTWYQVKNSKGEADIYPVARGKRWTEIPFVFFGAVANLPIPPKPPLLDLANLNIKHWQVNVDYYHGLHYCALPTPWAAGWPADSKLYIGPEKAWITEEPNAKAGYLEFTGAGLSAVRSALDKLEGQMAVVGARMLEAQKRMAEAAETWKIRVSEDVANLNTIVGSVEGGFVNVLGYMADWMGVSREGIEAELNRDFVSEKLDPQEIDTLLRALQAGEISQDTFLHNLQMGEILPRGRTIDEEKDLIEAEGRESFTGGEGI